VNRGADSSNHSDQCRLRIEKLMSEERVPKFENAMKRLAEHALKEDKRKKPRVEATTGRQRTVDDTDWDDIGKRVSKQIKVTDGRIIYTPDDTILIPNPPHLIQNPPHLIQNPPHGSMQVASRCIPAWHYTAQNGRQ